MQGGRAGNGQTRVDPEDIMLMKEARYSGLHFYRNVQKRQIQKDRRESNGFQGWGEGNGE